MPTKISDYENRVYLAIWRKAFHADEPFEIQLQTHHQALAMRMGMYRAVKPYRTEAKIDAELFEAAEKWTPVVKKDWTKVVMSPRQGNRIADAAMKELGFTIEDLMTPEELEAKQSAEAIMQELSVRGSAELSAENKFFTREG